MLREKDPTGALEQARGALGNRSDDGVLEYSYDGVFQNDGDLDGLPEKVHDFFRAFFGR